MAYWERKFSQSLQSQVAASKKHDMIMSLVVESMCAAIVDVLIDPELKQWNNDMLNGLFTPHEADIIKNIPLA